MMIIIDIIRGAALGFLGAEFLTQFDRLPDKPFKCNLCLTFWLTIAPFILLYGYHGIFMSALASIISEWMYRHI